MLRHPTTGQPRTNAELIGFKSATAFSGAKLKEAKEHLDLEYIEDSFEDLDYYCQAIMYNYKSLKKFIMDGYRRYFDEQDNLRVQPLLTKETMPEPDPSVTRFEQQDS